VSVLVIENARVVSAGALKANQRVICEGGKVVSVEGMKAPSPSGEVVDAKGMCLAPGFIDLHIHGSGGHLIDDGPDALAALCRLLPRYGVTSFLPTVCPLPPGRDEAFLRQLAQVRQRGSEILAFHLEGPFLARTGALNADALGRADVDRVQKLISAAGPRGAVFSVSPELENAPELIRAMSATGRPAFITHTGATAEQTQAAIEAGARHATHFYDVFPAGPEIDPGVRPCGTVEAILADSRVTVDFILDGEHVNPLAVELARLCKGRSGVCLITDANVGAGLPPGRHVFAGEEIEFRYPGGPARMTENARSPGALAGSGLTMDQALRNAMKMLKIDLGDALAMVSENPARVLGLAGSKGSISAGFDADLVLLDENLRVKQTWVAGRSVFTAA
jgi:N-acetylglucosamine-6-phosphate deacetylase